MTDVTIATTIIVGILGLMLGATAIVARLKNCSEECVSFAAHCSLGCFGAFALGSVILLQLVTR